MWVPYREMSRDVAIMQTGNKVGDQDPLAYFMRNVRVCLQRQNPNAIHEVNDFLIALLPNVIQFLNVGMDCIGSSKDLEELFSELVIAQLLFHEREDFHEVKGIDLCQHEACKGIHRNFGQDEVGLHLHDPVLNGHVGATLKECHFAFRRDLPRICGFLIGIRGDEEC